MPYHGQQQIYYIVRFDIMQELQKFYIFIFFQNIAKFYASKTLLDHIQQMSELDKFLSELDQFLSGFISSTGLNWFGPAYEQ